MSPASHPDRYLEAAFLHALGALPAGEAADFEAHLDVCPDCRREIDTLRPIVGAFAFWPTDVLRPPASLWDRLSRRIAAESGGDPLVPPPPAAGPEWKEVAGGISCKLLSVDAQRSRVTMLVRLHRGAEYPPHRHADVEELHLLDGELVIDEKTLYPGDYFRAEAGSVDRRVWSRTGCTCVLLTSTEDTLL